MSAEYVFLFPGQGSQYPEMAVDLYRWEPRFRAHLEDVDRCVRAAGGRALLPGLLRARTPFDDVRDTHPAIFGVQYASAMMLVDHGLRPSAVVGMSMGEFAAAVVSGAWPLEHAVSTLCRQASAIAESCTAGGMVAVLAPPALFPDLPGTAELVLESRRHFVVSGSAATLDRVRGWLDTHGHGHVRLPVTVGFHSAHIDPARKRFLATTRGSTWARRPGLPLYSCATAEARVTAPAPADLWHAIRAPIRFVATVSTLRGRLRYVDVGPGSATTTLMRDNGVAMVDCQPLSTTHSDVRHQLSRLLTGV